ncbi:MAG: SulP family inorganic anion transporter, partial [Phycisphaerae bacterium]
YRDSPREIVIYLATVNSIVTFDLLTGIAIGFGHSLLQLNYTFSHLVIEFEDDAASNESHMVLRGAATFVRLPKLASALERVPPTRTLHVYLEELDYIDHACLVLLKDWEKQHLATGGKLQMDWQKLQPRFDRQRVSSSKEALASSSS